MPFQVPPERTSGTAGDGSAEVLAYGHQQRMVFVVQRGIRGKVLHEECLHRIVCGIRPDQAVAAEDAAGIGIHHEAWLVPCIEQDRITGFRADTANRFGLGKNACYFNEFKGRKKRRL